MSADAKNRALGSRQDYRYFGPIQLRWADNDAFGHLNNVLYYRFFEHIIVDFLSNRTALDMIEGEVLTFAAESSCRFLRPLSFPDRLEAALRVDHLGNSSVRYGLALFREGEEDPAAEGSWVHVFVSRETQRPIPIPPNIRAAFEAIRA